MSNAIKAIVCDFDGTFSTLRCGWEAVMKRMMMKYLPDEEWIDSFIGETTGVQTILQMKGFLEEVKRRGGSQFTATAAGAINCAPPVADAQERVPPVVRRSARTTCTASRRSSGRTTRNG